MNTKYIFFVEQSINFLTPLNPRSLFSSLKMFIFLIDLASPYFSIWWLYRVLTLLRSSVKTRMAILPRVEDYLVYLMILAYISLQLYGDPNERASPNIRERKQSEVTVCHLF